MTSPLVFRTLGELEWRFGNFQMETSLQKSSCLKIEIPKCRLLRAATWMVMGMGVIAAIALEVGSVPAVGS